MEVLTYFRAEIETVGRQWLDIVDQFDDKMTRTRPTPDMNHVLWLTGHMAWAEDYLLMEVPSGQTLRRREWDSIFDHSSEKLPPEEYPAWIEVRAEYVKVHEAAREFLNNLQQRELLLPSKVERQWFPTAGHSIAHQVTHGHYHLGQLIYLHKILFGSGVVTPNRPSLLPSV